MTPTPQLHTNLRCSCRTNPFFSSATIVARVGDHAEGQLAAIRDTVQAIDRQVRVYSAKNNAEEAGRGIRPPKFSPDRDLAFAGFALLLTMIGVEGLLAYRVAQRTNEIGIRMALGATQSNLLRMVIRHAVAPGLCRLG